jgi:hypothetical protein
MRRASAGARLTLQDLEPFEPLRRYESLGDGQRRHSLRGRLSNLFHSLPGRFIHAQVV